MNILGTLIKPLLSNPPIQQDSDDPAVQRLSKVVTTVLDCCRFALFNNDFETLVPMLNAHEIEMRGFAYEGAGMGLACLDAWLPWKRRTRKFVTGPGALYMHAVYLGVGLAFARMGRNPQRFQKRLPDPFVRWAVFDGYGYLKGFAFRQRFVEERAEPKFRGYASRVFDQGLGRSIWFSEHGTVERIASVIQSFPEGRRPDLWSGVGYGCTYAGGVDDLTLEALHEAAGQYRFSLAVGAVAAAQTRHQIGNPVAHNDAACRALCGLTSGEAARMADEAMRDLPSGSDEEPAFEIWRRRIQEHLEGDSAHSKPLGL